ncbi:MAG: M48 family metalloprotease [Bacilli bacterium]
MKKNLFGISLITMGILYGMLSVIVFFICFLCDIEISLVILISIIIFIIQFLISPILTDISMKWFYKASFDEEIPEYLKNEITKMCNNHKMNYPKIGIIMDGAPNAFTYGLTKNNARIVITRGLLELLNEKEVVGVIAHEIGHAVHYDMIFMCVAQLVPLVLYYVYNVFADNADNDNDKLAIVGLIAYVFYIISQYVILWLSRTREYYADEFAILETKDPNSFAEALVKIGYGLTASSSKNAKLSVSKPNTLGIFDAKTSKSLIVSSYNNGSVSKENIKNAMKWEKWNIWAKYYEFFSTHPLISKRLEAISNRSKEFNQEPYIVFDEKQPESYIDDFFYELFLICSGTIIFILFIILLYLYAQTDNNLYINLCIFLPFIFLVIEFIKYNRSHKNSNYKNYNISDLLSIIKVSSVTSVPCLIEGEVIGKGDPGCIFDEDFVIKDDTGIIFIDYKRVISFMNMVDGLTKTKSLFGKKVKIKGWYRRNPVPYVEIYEMEVEGCKSKRFYSSLINKIILVIFIIISLLFIVCFI